MSDADVEEGAWVQPPAARAQPEGDDGGDDATAGPARRERAAPAASKGAEAFDSVKNGARYTLQGLRGWQAAGRWAQFAQFISLIAAAVLVGRAGLALAGVTGLGFVGTAGLYIGVLALAMWLWALFHFLLGLRSARRGRDELGYLQRRYVDQAFTRVVRGLVAFAVVGVVAGFFGFQAEMIERAGRMPDAVLYGLVAGAVAGAIGVWHFSTAAAGVLRNLTPNAGRRGRRRMVALLHVWAIPVVAVYLVGAPLSVMYFDIACQDLGGCPTSEIVPVVSPSYGAPFRLLSEPPAALYLEIPLIAAALLLVLRLVGYAGLRAFNAQLEEADRFLVRHVAARAAAVERPVVAA